jgi:hypothetical protein
MIVHMPVYDNLTIFPYIALFPFYYLFFSGHWGWLEDFPYIPWHAEAQVKVRS